jgi:hypothetical protein
VQGSKIFDGATGAGCGSAGTTSYGIELPFGGVANIIDDALVQGAATKNNGMLAYGAEGLPYANNSLFVGQGTSFVSSGVANSIGIRGFAGTPGTGLASVRWSWLRVAWRSLSSACRGVLVDAMPSALTVWGAPVARPLRWLGRCRRQARSAPY